MATELRTIPTTEITQTRFFGGQDRGTMLQLTVHDRGSFQSISITREQAARVAQELLLFANGNEVPDFVETS
jgi:ATP-dependent Clp protease adapter protein ClpS